MTEERQKLLNKVSKLYREYCENVSIFKNEIREIKDKLRDKNITHNQYLDLKAKLQFAEEACVFQENIARGINLAREELFED